MKNTYIGYFWKSYSHSPTLHQIVTVLRILLRVLKRVLRKVLLRILLRIILMILLRNFPRILLMILWVSCLFMIFYGSFYVSQQRWCAVLPKKNWNFSYKGNFSQLTGVPPLSVSPKLKNIKIFRQLTGVPATPVSQLTWKNV